ncbi:conserved Plasmodium protein, unknown function [Plasmodium vivax]|uniref:Macro domain-containing protein n=6 Tax=Plasmodium vivax TaxID=5855 RepID=A5KAG2_PLAVS|nr:hypothetical protein, conserved [Plasmodium vivax]KMZ82696.1 hypothetical protein PVIIG_02481 [Plasmodium vivax India VII]KMZ89090.1 hypothetical protein PVBG_03054 [Plasmodium vivax Brazil I]KMZ95306.1 hypothetical protein PVMG_05174 [Plasmodium vivax Mauritania I]KNA01801.1 hypothetical protein PVNG_02878 [Plasmodium vivax North Korean]EDL43561.1 hypothetical protein, conserved [Plasmodium vivax]|eukprot:XP_001613288.1 hypothetical protein [Plasmodium vivax Sal-1]
MSVGDKLNEAFCWLKEEFDELMTDLEVDKGELNVSDLCTKINNTWRSINGGEEESPLCADSQGGGRDKKRKERINHEELVPWSDLNYSLFHYVGIYKKVSEALLIDDEDFYFNFDADNVYVKRRFSPSLAFHPLICPIDAAYFNFLLFCISGGAPDKAKGGEANGGEAKWREVKWGEAKGDTSIGGASNWGTSIEGTSNWGTSFEGAPNWGSTAPPHRRRGSRAEITYAYSDDRAYKENFVVTQEAYAALSEEYTKVPGVQRCLERGAGAPFNFGPRGGAAVGTSGTSGTIGGGTGDTGHIGDAGGTSEGGTPPDRAAHTAAPLNREALNRTYAFSLESKTYMVHPEMNKKIKIVNGDISAVDSEAVVLFANHNYRFSKRVCDDLYSCTLMKLDEEERIEIKSKKSGEVCLTNSYDGIHKYILHVMLPKYNSKYILATHNTMNLCVQEILCVCVEKRVQSVSIPIVCFGLFFPTNIFLVSLMKSLRSLLLLPQFYNAIRSIVFVTNSNELYLLTLKYASVFFPRCREEMFLSANIAILGNKLGSIDVRNRGIRIFKTLRRVTRGALAAESLAAGSSAESLAAESAASFASSAASSSAASSASSSVIFNAADEEFLSLRAESEGHQHLYMLQEIKKREEGVLGNLQSCLRLSCIYNIKKKFAEFEEDSFLYEYGVDELGRKTVIINFFKFPRVYNYHSLFLFLLFHFNSFMRNHFVLLFVFSEGISGEITNVLSLFKDLFQLVSDFLHNLRVVYFFNYSLAFKLFICVLYPFIPAAIYDSIVYLNGAQELSKHFDVKKALRQ